MNVKKNLVFIILFQSILFSFAQAFEYPGAQREYAMGAQAGAQGAPDPCAFAGTICADAYLEAQHERRVEKRIYDSVRYSRS